MDELLTGALEDELQDEPEDDEPDRGARVLAQARQLLGRDAEVDDRTHLRFKQGAITEDTFAETYSQFKRDKAELEKQIKAKLKTE